MAPIDARPGQPEAPRAARGFGLATRTGARGTCIPRQDGTGAVTSWNCRVRAWEASPGEGIGAGRASL